MDKLNLATGDIYDENVRKLGELFPDVVTEVQEPDGTLRHVIDTEALQAHVGDVASDARERYQFTWPGKREAKAEAHRRIDKTMRPCPEKSVDWDTTGNLYIEGDNLDALKILRDTYAGKVKMIYIDPPYNTGHDFVYNDNRAQSVEDYEDASGAIDDEGRVLDTAYKENTESNGRFHSDWCSMMYPRLMLARDLLSEDGAIFISIDDGESASLIKLLDEVFGERNGIATICHKARASISNDKIISSNHNLITFYAKQIELIESRKKLIGIDPDLDGFSEDDDDGRGAYRLVPVDGPGGAKKGNPFYEFAGIKGYWRFSQETMRAKYDDGLIVKRGNSLYQKYYLADAAKSRKTVSTWWDDAGLTSTATSRLKKMMNSASFDTPKPLELIERMLKMMVHGNPDSLILDFFSGSATTAHAVMQLNAEDGGNRRFIMVQLPEVCDEKSEAAKAGYRTICEIGEERIRRAGRKIAQEVAEHNRQLKLGEEPRRVPDVGFRVLRIDSSNLAENLVDPSQATQLTLAGMVNNVKPGRTPLDLLFQVLPKFQIPFTARIEEQDIEGRTVYRVDGGRLLACFEPDVPTSVIVAMAKQEPAEVVMGDASFMDDAAVSNFEELFRTYSPGTQTHVL